MPKKRTQTQTEDQSKNHVMPERSGATSENKLQEQEQIEVVNTMKYRCLDIAQEYINNLDDPKEIKSNDGLFVDMIKTIYDQYIADILNNRVVSNGSRYDYILLDSIFKIYCSLVYKYKHNKRASILEFSIFTNIDSDTLYNAIHGKTRKLTNIELSIVKKWVKECENTLTNGGSVFEIFLLKSQYRYNDNLAPLPVQDTAPVMTFEELPALEDKTEDKKTPQ